MGVCAARMREALLGEEVKAGCVRERPSGGERW